MLQFHPFHLVQMSPWPILGSLSAGSLLLLLVDWFYHENMTMTILPLLAIIMIFYSWWRDVVRESTFSGYHSIYVQEGLEWGMIMFIMSEVMFFFAFFWTFYHSSLSPNIEIGMKWPPPLVLPLDPFSVPLLNTVVLLTSGATVTLTHNSICDDNPDVNSQDMEALTSLIFTIILGFYFTLLQKEEYFSTSFTMSDSVYGSIFFVATGFHGLHVMIGAAFLSITFYRMWANHFSSYHHFGFEAASWYWHFVDVVWIFLYINLYWWLSL